MSKITVAGFETAAGSQWSGDTAYLRIYYYGSNPAAFSFSTGEVWSPSVDNFYREIPCDLADNVVTVDTLILDSTPDITNRPDVFCRMVLLDSSRSEDSQVLLADRWDIPISLGTSVTFEQLRIHNETPVVRFDDRASLSRTAIEELIDDSINVGNPATTSAIGRVKASATPTDAASPVAIVEGDGRAGKSSANYASLSAAVTAIGSTPTDLYIVGALASGASCTVPATLALRFASGGSLVLGSGHTVNVNSETSGWPVRQIFSGSGVVSFAANRSVKYLYPQWWVVGDNSTDDSTALQAAQTASGASLIPLFWTAGLKVRITSTVTSGGNPLTWIGEGIVGGNSGTNQPQLNWGGSAGGLMLDCPGVNHYMKLTGIMFNLQGADKAIKIDGDGNEAKVIIDNCLFVQNQTRSTTKVISLSEVTVQNVENITVSNTQIQTSPSSVPGVARGTGVYIGGNSNGISLRFEKVWIRRGSYGIYATVQGGQLVRVSDSFLMNNDTDVYFRGTDLGLINIRSEGSRQFLDIDSEWVEINHCSIQNTGNWDLTIPLLAVGNFNAVDISNTYIGDPSTGATQKVFEVNGGAANNATLFSRNNFYYPISGANLGLTQFNGGASFNDTGFSSDGTTNGSLAAVFLSALTFREITLTNNSATPSVQHSNSFVASNSGATVITNFQWDVYNATGGQRITVRFSNGNTTVQNNANIKLAGGVNFVGTADDMLTLERRGTVWYEVGRSVN